MLTLSDVFNFFIRDESLRNTELTSKLEPAFLAGLRCSQSDLRQKFVEVFDASIRRRLFDRLHYIITSQNWESMAGHFWIKQCIEVSYDQPVLSLFSKTSQFDFNEKFSSLVKQIQTGIHTTISFDYCSLHHL